jgi:hypothetical protein
MEIETNILIFKTNIAQPQDKELIAELLEIPDITQWSVDMDDIDCVLRIVTSGLDCNEIINRITSCGYFCEELD